MTAASSAAWANFFVAEAGASAALAGLLFVAVSINLTRVLQFPHLPGRAAEALFAFLSVLAIATLALVPGLSPCMLGVAIASVGVASWSVNVVMLARTWRVSAPYGIARRFAFNQLPPVPFVVAGVLLATDHASGMYWIVPGTLLSFMAGLFGAWVLLIEIQR
jgi:modulator of FtsH protease